MDATHTDALASQALTCVSWSCDSRAEKSFANLIDLLSDWFKRPVTLSSSTWRRDQRISLVHHHEQSQVWLRDLKVKTEALLNSKGCVSFFRRISTSFPKSQGWNMKSPSKTFKWDHLWCNILLSLNCFMWFASRLHVDIPNYIFTLWTSVHAPAMLNV